MTTFSPLRLGCGELALNFENRVFVVVEQDQLADRQGGNLAAQFRADGTARTCDHHHFVGQQAFQPAVVQRGQPQSRSALHNVGEPMQRRRFGLETAAVVGFSLGAFQSVLAAAGGFGGDVPVVAIACTNRYVHGIRYGSLGHGMRVALREVAVATECVADGREVADHPVEPAAHRLDLD